MDEGEFKTYQVWEALRDPQAWLLFLYTISVNITNGGITSFSSLIIAEFGFTPLKSLLVQMPIGAFQLLALLITSLLASYVKNLRLTQMITAVIVSLVGMIMIYTISSSDPNSRLAGVWLNGIFPANIPLSLSLITSNVGGFTKRATVSTMLFIAYCIGNIIGPQFFYALEAPAYPTGIRATLSGFALAIFYLLCLLCYYVFDSNRRDRLDRSSIQTANVNEIVEEVLNKIDRELQTFRYVW